ncbi:putative uncharacterized protein DDB_G0282133 [Zerene cesonia]|uniref:putative uncharacterized protein DDB_G0282133 n=1 Tax=Zerene cesonia TaxID=33412 RepID=UPI0018E58EEF|nr:putative uncharacterized protein DDB_G0282133 [Zerene cesonia]
MKLIILTFLVTSLAVYTKCQRIQQEQFPFPPQFQTPSSGIMVSDSSIYLPPEPQTPIPYFAINHMNKLPFQFLPPSGTKAPSVYPTPFSGIFSSTLRPRFDEDDEDENEQISQIRISTQRPVINHNPNQLKINMTERNQEKRENRALPQMFNYQPKFQQKPQSRIDGKEPQSFQPASTQGPPNSNSASRRMILTSEIQRNDITDHLKSHSNSAYSQIPNIFFSSTTEPAIPILRLSNEMDLDGSFSYEALGADQTHYVQHSRMENMGTDKEEQVVEGSYSYVGDNGQTYTVHYVADSNGYRASGEHLPSPPPIPEIIQRAVQYNLAEEARRPPHMKSSWDENENENNAGDKSSHFTSTPSRSLFTGRTPEAFSFGFSQNSNSQNNMAATSASSHIPKTSFDIAVELSKAKANVGAIGPQITFSASQGAHNPSSSIQQPVSRSSTNEKSSMPQLMNYEASGRDIDSETKPLWRWQYGMNPNNPEQNSNKNTISRSSADGDDVIINFNDMTPDQYTDMIRSQFLGQNANEATEYNNNYYKNNFEQSTTFKPNPHNYIINNNNDYNYNYNHNHSQNKNDSELRNYFEKNYSTQNEFYEAFNEAKIISTTTESSNILQRFERYEDEVKIQPKNNVHNPYPNIIRQQNFIPPSQQVTQSYDYDDTSYEPKKVAIDTYSNRNNENISNQQVNIIPPNRYWYSSEENRQTTTIQPHLSTMIEIKPTINNNFQPIIHSKDSNKQELTTEKNMEELIQENIFLKNIVRTKKQENTQQTNTEHKTDLRNNTNVSEQKEERTTKHAQFYPKPQNEIKNIKKKPLDITDVLNYIAMKNHMEFSKTKPKSKSAYDNYQANRDAPVNFIPLEEEKQENMRGTEERSKSYRTLNQQEEELQGIIKNYKVLQRQRNSAHNNNQYSDVPQKHVKTFHSPGLPPLGRAGPSMKSYLPPAYL